VRLLCWGGNDYAQVGVGREGPDGVRLRVDRPVALDSESDWLAVATGDFHGCAYKSAPGLFCWGSASEGQLGAGAKEVSDTPTRVPLLEDVRHLALGAAHSCALDAAHKLYCWGDNAQGQLGLDDTNGRDQPVQVNLML
jgi:alpha-tubulin suppressor-like RCC1 family protein